MATSENNSLDLNNSTFKNKAWKFGVLMSCMLGTSFYGISSALFSLIYQDMIISYESSTTLAGWIGSLQIGLGNVLSIFFGLLLEKFGMQKVGIAASIFCCIGYIISYLTTSLLVTALSMGVLSGICLSMMAIICFTMGYSYASEKERAFNGNIISFGFSLGALVGGVIVRFYPSHWPWKYILILYACINLHFVPLCVLFLKDSTMYSYKNKINGIEKNKSKEVKGLGLELKNIPPIDGDEVDLYDNAKKPNGTEIIIEEITTEENMLLEGHHNKLQINGGSHKKDILDNSSQRNPQLQNDKTLNSVQIYIQKLSIILKDPKCVCYFISIFIVHISFMTFLQHGPRWMITLGISKEQSSYFPMVVASISALTKCVNTCLLLTLFNHIDKIRPLILHLGVFMLGTMACSFIQIASPSFQSFISVLLISALYSIFMGFFTSFMSVITLGLVGLERLPQGQILFAVFSGAGCLISTPFGGLLYDNYDYTVTFVVTGIMCILGSLFSLLAIFLSVSSRKKN